VYACALRGTRKGGLRRSRLSRTSHPPAFQRPPVGDCAATMQSVVGPVPASSLASVQCVWLTQCTSVCAVSGGACGAGPAWRDGTARSGSRARAMEVVRWTTARASTG
jgi:hypothetical protein